ncbi:hypothetical protein LDENG_00078960 [Lucifuga dentata]|nr:hypothetical protein LDENG_00078960 [Lucifuga dentata]
MVHFVSEVWSEVARSLGVALHHSTAYHPQANGLCEHFHHQAVLTGDAWANALPWVLLSLQTAHKEDLGSSAVEMPPYDGLFPVVEAGDKTFLVDFGACRDWVSVDRLKPAHMDVAVPALAAVVPCRGHGTTAIIWGTVVPPADASPVGLLGEGSQSSQQSSQASE